MRTLDGKSFAIVNQREVLLYDATTHRHMATLDAQEISAAKGGGFVGTSRTTWRPTLWSSDGREIASLQEASPPPAEGEVAFPLLVSRNGQIAVQRSRKSLQATVWDLQRRTVVRTLVLGPYSKVLLSNSGRYLASEGVSWKEPAFVVETLTGQKLPLPNAFTDEHPRLEGLVGQDGFLFRHDDRDSSVLPTAPYVRAIRPPFSVGGSDLRFLDAEVALVNAASGSSIWDTKSNKVIRRLDGESLNPTVDGEGRYFVTRREAPWNSIGLSWKYLVHSTLDGKLLAEFSGDPPLAFRPTTDQLTHLDDAGNLVAFDVRTQEVHAVAPAGRLESALSAWDFGFSSLARDEKLLLAHDGRAPGWKTGRFVVGAPARTAS